MERLRTLQNKIAMEVEDALGSEYSRELSSFVQGLEKAKSYVDKMIREIEAPRKEVFIHVQSDSKDKTYLIHFIPETGITSCTCEAWKYSHKKPKMCKHIKKVADILRTEGAKI